MKKVLTLLLICFITTSSFARVPSNRIPAPRPHYDPNYHVEKDNHNTEKIIGGIILVGVGIIMLDYALQPSYNNPGQIQLAIF